MAAFTRSAQSQADFCLTATDFFVVKRCSPPPPATVLHFPCPQNRYKQRAESAEARYLAALRNETARERRLDDDKYDENRKHGHVFDGEDADALARKAGEESAVRERSAERRERAEEVATAAHESARRAAAAARANGSAARVAAEEAAEAGRGAGRVFTSRDKLAADAAAEREASTEEAAWEKGVAR